MAPSMTHNLSRCRRLGLVLCIIAHKKVATSQAVNLPALGGLGGDKLKPTDMPNLPAIL